MSKSVILLSVFILFFTAFCKYEPDNKKLERASKELKNSSQEILKKVNVLWCKNIANSILPVVFSKLDKGKSGRKRVAFALSSYVSLTGTGIRAVRVLLNKDGKVTLFAESWLENSERKKNSGGLSKIPASFGNLYNMKKFSFKLQGKETVLVSIIFYINMKSYDNLMKSKIDFAFRSLKN